MSLSIGVNSAPRNITDLYIGVNNASRKITEMYIGVNGVPRLFYRAGPKLGDFTAGSIVKIKESGVFQNFKVAKHNYVQNGVTAIERVLCLTDKVAFSYNRNVYNGGDLDNFLTGTYQNRLAQNVRNALVTVNIPVTPGNGNYNLTTIARSTFVFSGTEIGFEHQYMINEGSKVDIYTDNPSRIKYSDDAPATACVRWTRSAYTYNINNVWRVSTIGTWGNHYATNASYLAPVLTLPSSTPVNDDGTIA